MMMSVLKNVLGAFHMGIHKDDRRHYLIVAQGLWAKNFCDMFTFTVDQFVLSIHIPFALSVSGVLSLLLREDKP
jgi:hypothetical protein